MQAARQFRTSGSGYSAIQATRPQTLAYGPHRFAGRQLAWITEKFGEWTDNGTAGRGGRPGPVAHQRHAVLADRDGGLAARLYDETVRARAGAPTARSTVPTGVAVFPREITPPIRRFAEQSDNIVRWTEFGRGGHFAAMEVPDLLTGDVREFFRGLRSGRRD